MGRAAWRLISMVKRRPQLRLDELHQLKWALGSLLAVLSAWTVLFLDIEATAWVIAVTLAGCAVVIWPTLPTRLPAVTHRFAVPVIVAFFAYDLYTHRQPLPSMVKLELMLLLYRVITYRKRRDDLQLILLGLFLVIVTGVLTVSPLFAVQILAFTACALAFLLLTTLADSALPVGGGKIAELGGPAQPPGWAVEVKWRELLSRVRAATDWRVIVLGALLFVGVVATSGVLFMAIPRFEIGNNLFLDRLIQKKTKTGFSDNIRFGEVTSIQEDTGIAMTVDVSDPSLIPGVPYWRMVVLDEYREGGFKMSMELAGELARRRLDRRTRVLGDAAYRGRQDEVWRFYYEPGVSRFLPLGGEFFDLTFSRPVPLDFSPTLRMAALTTEPVDLLGFQVRGLDFNAVLPDPEFADRDQGRVVPTRRMPDYRRMQVEAKESLKVVQMVSEFTGNDVLSAEEFAQKACDWLWKHHTYSMESRLGAGPTDPLVRWLESKGPGHCEFFAGAFALLANAAGHPVRIVTGFKGGSWNSFSNSLIVRHAHAHAWCEIWNGKDAWIRVDPTPGTTAAVGEPSREVAAADLRERIVDRGWSARIESLRVFWYRRVVNFDQKTQVEIASEAKRGFDGVFSWVKERSQSLLNQGRGWMDRPWNSTRALMSLGALLVVALSVWLLIRLRRTWGWRAFHGWGRQTQGDPVRKEASRWLVRLRTKGVIRPDDDEGRRVLGDLERLRYGPKVLGGQAVPVFTRTRRYLSRRKAAEGKTRY